MSFAVLPTGARLHYIDTASMDKAKPAMLLIHGMLGTAETHFEHVIKWLEPSFRVIAPTLRGYGQSEPKPRTFPYDFYHKDANDVLALMDALNLNTAHILGYSDGGETALLSAGSQPERFNSVMTIGAIGFYGPAMRPVVQRMFPGNWISDEEVALHGIPNRDAFVLGWMKSVQRIIDSGGDLSLTIAERIAAPLLMMLGERDALNPPEYAKKVIARAQNARLQMFNCGHGVHQEAWEEFQRMAGEFLTSV
jgi:valacyclovir hydrolase